MLRQRTPRDLTHLARQDSPHDLVMGGIYAPTSNAEEAEVERFYEDLQDLLEQTPKKDVLFIIGCQEPAQEIPPMTRSRGET